MARASKADKAADKRIERAYCATCDGIQIDIMDISKVFAHGKQALASDPNMDDAALGVAVRAFVETIRKN